jgi:perosamine synthetase
VIRLTDCKLTEFDKDNISNYLRDRAKGQEFNYVKDFESSFSKYIGRKYCIAVNSGTSALHLSLLALDSSSMFEIITTTHTCVSILNAINYVHATPILVDCNYNVVKMDYNLSELMALNKINDKTKAIIIPHMFGVPAELSNITGKRIAIIEDGTHSLGSRYKDGSYVGSKGDISIFSLHCSKMLSASTGGAILTDNDEYYYKIINLLSYDIKEVYSPAYNYRMGEINAVLARSQLCQLENYLLQRSRNAANISQQLTVCKDIILPNIERQHVYYRYLLELPEDHHPDVFIKKGLENGIEFGRGVYPALHNYLHLSEKDFNNSEKFQKHILSIPVHCALTEKEIEYICGSFKKILSI